MTNQTNQQRNIYLLVGAIIVAGAIIGGAVIFSNSQPSTETPQEQQQAKEDKQKPQPSEKDSAPNAKLAVKGEPYLGDPSAPVEIVYYGDFQCPFCKRIEENAFSRVIEKYVKKGKAVLYFKNFAFLGPDSTTAAIAGECLVNQSDENFDSYWKWHNAMLEKQDGENSGFGNAEDIKSLVEELNLSGIDVAQFENCLGSEKTKSEVTSDTSEGRNDGVSGTPATFVNGQMLGGAKPFSAFESAIEAELNK